MKRISHFRFSRSQRSGIFFLGLCIVLVQVLVWWGVFEPKAAPVEEGDPSVEMINAYLDSLEKVARPAYAPRPFNPNYMSDQKGYMFGMTPEDIDRLFDFRERGGFVNSPAEFQEVTGVHDSVLGAMKPYFKFPRFAQTRVQAVTKRIKKNINSAGVEDLEEVYGIGPVLADRIVAYRDRLNGFSEVGQLEEVFGLPVEVLPELWRYFHLDSPAVHRKLNINKAGLAELSALPYVSQSLASKIVAYRSVHERMDSLGELTKIHNLSEKDLGRIGLYLTVE